MKRILPILLSIVVAVGLLAGCAVQTPATTDSSSQTEEALKEEPEESLEEEPEESLEEEPGESVQVEPFKLGYSGFIDAATMEKFIRPVKWAVEGAGGELLADYAPFTAEGSIASVENLISAGCDIIMFSNVTGEAPLPAIAKLCDDNEVYLVLWDTTVTTPEIQETLANSSYLIGYTSEDEKQRGYDGTKILIEAGAKNIIVFKYAVGVATCDYRVEGAQAACDEMDAEIVAILEAPQDHKKAMSDILIAHPEADGLFVAGGGAWVVSMHDAIKEADRKVYISTINLFDGLETYLDDESILMCSGGHFVTGFAAALMAINAFYGTPLSEEQYTITVPQFDFTESVDYLNYKKHCEDDSNPVYSPDDVKQLLKVYNPDITLESFQKIITDSWNIENIVKKFSE